jgi:hypothetical protein
MVPLPFVAVGALLGLASLFFGVLVMMPFAFGTLLFFGTLVFGLFVMMPSLGDSGTLLFFPLLVFGPFVFTALLGGVGIAVFFTTGASVSTGSDPGAGASVTAAGGQDQSAGTGASVVATGNEDGAVIVPIVGTLVGGPSIGGMDMLSTSGMDITSISGMDMEAVSSARERKLVRYACDSANEPSNISFECEDHRKTDELDRLTSSSAAGR